MERGPYNPSHPTILSAPHMTRPQKTLGDLKRAGIHVLPVREEMRRNLIDRMTRRERILPGIIGYDDTVVPEIENAILAGHHMVFLGERGQAKSRIIRGLVDAARRGRPGRRRLRDQRRSLRADLPRVPPPRSPSEGDALPIAWLGARRTATARSSPRPTSRSPT